jgi:hypothetical protein
VLEPGGASDDQEACSPDDNVERAERKKVVMRRLNEGMQRRVRKERAADHPADGHETNGARTPHGGRGAWVGAETLEVMALLSRDPVV